MGIAVFQGLIGLVGWTVYSVAYQFGIVEWLITFSGGFFLVLAIVARFQRVPAAVIACGLYATYLGFQALQSVQLLADGFFLIKLPVVLLLLYAFVTALRPAEQKLSEPGTA